jgi:hypothetical protein
VCNKKFDLLLGSFFSSFLLRSIFLDDPVSLSWLLAVISSRSHFARLGTPFSSLPSRRHRRLNRKSPDTFFILLTEGLGHIPFLSTMSLESGATDFYTKPGLPSTTGNPSRNAHASQLSPSIPTHSQDVFRNHGTPFGHDGGTGDSIRAKMPADVLEMDDEAYRPPYIHVCLSVQSLDDCRASQIPDCVQMSGPHLSNSGVATLTLFDG